MNFCVCFFSSCIWIYSVLVSANKVHWFWSGKTCNVWIIQEFCHCRMQHWICGISLQLSIFFYDMTFHRTKPANRNSSLNVVADCGKLPGTETAHAKAYAGNTLFIYLWQTCQKFCSPAVFLGNKSGKTCSHVEHIRSQRLLASCAEIFNWTVAPAKRIKTQNNITALCKFVARIKVGKVLICPCLWILDFFVQILAFWRKFCSFNAGFLVALDF